MTNPVLGQAIVSIGIRNLAQLGRIGGIPIQHEVLRRNSGKSFQCFSPGCSVVGKFIFYNENQTRSTYFLGCVLQFFVYRLTMRRLVLQAPEIEAADAVRRGRFRDLNAAMENFILLIESKMRSEYIACCKF